MHDPKRVTQTSPQEILQVAMNPGTTGQKKSFAKQAKQDHHIKLIPLQA